MKRKTYISIVYDEQSSDPHVNMPLLNDVNFYKYGKIAENYLEKYKDELWWSLLALHQPLSNKFIAKYKDKLDFGWLELNNKIDKVFIEKLKMLE